MKLNELKEILKNQDTIAFELPDGSLVPKHFHVTEIGKVVKDFIDCGGNVRKEKKASLQLWNANDYNHRLHPEKLIKIINLSQETLELGNWDIEVEYQGETIGKYGLDFKGKNFLLTSKETDCLAKADCGVPLKSLQLVSQDAASCAPGSGCC